MSYKTALLNLSAKDLLKLQRNLEIIFYNKMFLLETFLSENEPQKP